MSAIDLFRSFADSREKDEVIIKEGIRYGHVREIISRITRLEQQLAEAQDTIRSFSALYTPIQEETEAFLADSSFVESFKKTKRELMFLSEELLQRKQEREKKHLEWKAKAELWEKVKSHFSKIFMIHDGTEQWC